MAREEANSVSESTLVGGSSVHPCGRAAQSRETRVPRAHTLLEHVLIQGEDKYQTTGVKRAERQMMTETVARDRQALAH